MQGVQETAANAADTVEKNRMRGRFGLPNCSFLFPKGLTNEFQESIMKQKLDETNNSKFSRKKEIRWETLLL